MKGFIILAFIINVVCPEVPKYHVFVYGTLKKGQPNYSKMEVAANGQPEFLAYARTVERYPLVIGTQYNIPFLLNVPGMGHRVYGEIYHVNQTLLDFLDKFEECPKWYQRIKIKLEVQDRVGEGKNTLKNGSIKEAFVYVKTITDDEWLQKPTYESYDTNAEV
ncbi:hypothetical protein QQF64_001638 [Cirrhinus molitorella]|uniref:Gamma-glutamylaminecyclotransferase n=1 Tax=Cirrhinus molitorella TaxID=172907 RepID=A0ABR3P230_9TELE